MTAYLLTAVPDHMTAAFTELLGTFDLEATEHGPGCCCKNCPWNGDHGNGGWKDSS